MIVIIQLSEMYNVLKNAISTEIHFGAKKVLNFFLYFALNVVFNEQEQTVVKNVHRLSQVTFTKVGNSGPAE